MWGNNYGGYYPMPGTNGYNYPSGNMGQNMPQQQNQGTQPQATPITWVAGIGEVEAAYVAPGCTADFWDSKLNIIYLKTVDNTGRPSIERLQWSKCPEEQVTQNAFNPNEYLTKKEFEAWLKSLKETEGEEE